MVTAGGVWAFPPLIVGLISVLAAILNLFLRNARIASLCKYFAFASLCLGIAGTAMGLYQAGSAMGTLNAEKVPVSMLMSAIGIASTTTFIGAALSGLSTLILGVASPFISSD